MSPEVKARLEGALDVSRHYLTAIVEPADLRAALAHIAALEEALRPFSQFGTDNTDHNGWQSNIHKERISYWFGPSDFRRAAALLPSLPIGEK